MPGPRAFSGSSRSAARWYANSPNWWDEHYVDAASTIFDFLADDGLAIADRRVLDLGCGDGIISLALAMRGADVVGVDLEAVDQGWLRSRASEHGVTGFPPQLRFDLCQSNEIPAVDHWFDVVIAWSVFEHVVDQTTLLKEVRRILKPNGALFIQIWPLWSSRHGSHLWPWHERDFDHLIRSSDELLRTMRAAVEDPELADSFVDLFGSCNRSSIDDLQRSLLEAGFHIAKVSLQADTFHVPPELQQVSLSQLGISGIQLLAVRT
jgi:SAM-dependent methyltransferase